MIKLATSATFIKLRTDGRAIIRLQVSRTTPMNLTVDIDNLDAGPFDYAAHTLLRRCCYCDPVAGTAEISERLLADAQQALAAAR